jgi:hypothetical protein
MSVDKFGRYAKRKEAVIGPKGIGYNLTPEGDYDIQLKRLRNVEDAIDDFDAVNYKTHIEAFRNCISLQNGQFDAQKTRICNLAQPVETDDAVTLQYVDSHTPIKLDEKKVYSVHQYRLQDVAFPEIDGDAVNLSYMKDHTINKSKDFHFDAKGYVIQNVGPPENEGDSINLSFLRNHTFTKNKDGVYDVQNTVIQNLAPPSKAGDAVNKAYIDNRLPVQGARAWHFKNKRLTNVSDPDPDNVHDVVTLNYFNRHAILHGSEGNWDIREKRLKSVADPIELSDGVNKRYVKEIVGSLGYALYKALGKGKRDHTMSAEDWNAQVMLEKTPPWDRLFNLES